MTNRIAGRRAKSNGQRFEELIEQSNQYYQKSGIAYIQKTPEPMRPIKRAGAGRFIAYYEKKGQPDFQGTLKGGTSIVFEAKNTDSTNIRFDRVTDNQLNQLSQHQKLGGLSLILISFSLKSFYSVPLNEWERLMHSLNKKSVNQADLAEYKSRYIKGRVNYLENIEYWM